MLENLQLYSIYAIIWLFKLMLIYACHTIFGSPLLKCEMVSDSSGSRSMPRISKSFQSKFYINCLRRFALCAGHSLYRGAYYFCERGKLWSGTKQKPKQHHTVDTHAIIFSSASAQPVGAADGE
jgi:hypothetical protein